MITGKHVIVPQDVRSELRTVYIENYLNATQNTGRLMLFAGEHNTEYLTDYDSAPKNTDPENLFRIAAKAKIGVFATLPEELTRYGIEYSKIPYVVKFNYTIHSDAKHTLTVNDLMTMKKKNNLKILGMRCNIHFGSEYESKMIEHAAKLISDAHEHGLLAIVWAYIQKNSSQNQHFLAEVAQKTASLGADFVKVSYTTDEDASLESLKEAVQTAGRTKLVCAGGTVTDARKFLETLYTQIHVSGAAGNATGRNIHQKPFEEAVRFCNAISAITLENKSVKEAYDIYSGTN